MEVTCLLQIAVQIVSGIIPRVARVVFLRRRLKKTLDKTRPSDIYLFICIGISETDMTGVRRHIREGVENESQGCRDDVRRFFINVSSSCCGLFE